MHSAICKFWCFFYDNHKDFNETNYDLIYELADKLKAIDPVLAFEIMPTVGENKQFILSADGIEDSFDILNLVYDYRVDVEGWDFIKYRQPLHLEEGFYINMDPENSDDLVNFTDILFTLEDHPIVGVGVIINFFIPGYQEENSQHEMYRWIILDQCIGEYDAVKRIALYNTFPLSEADKSKAKSVIFDLKQDLDELRLKYIKEFWNIFFDNRMNLVNEGEGSQIFHVLESKLKLINHDIIFVIYIGNSDNKNQFVLTSNGIEEAFEAIDLLYQYKPEVEEWNLCKYRQPLGKDIIQTIDYCVPLTDIMLFMSRNSHDKCTILFFIPGYLGNDDDEAFLISRKLCWRILCDSLGEYDTAKKVSFYECNALEQAEDLYELDKEKLKSALYLKDEFNKCIS